MLSLNLTKRETRAPLQAKPIPKPSSRRPFVPDIKEEVVSLANEAASVLGYTRLLNDRVKPLAKTLQRLEIEVLDEVEVHQYMDSQRNEVNKSRDKYNWVKFRLDQKEEFNGFEDTWKYDKPIPEHVIAKAVQIKKEVPRASFFVHQLSTRNPDPFLSVVLGEESYFIEIWDEPKFEGRLTKEE